MRAITAPLGAGLARAIGAGVAGAEGAAPGGDGRGWEALSGILRRIAPPEFPARGFSIEEYGAVGDGRADCRRAFADAIAACRAAGGGTVVVPRGEFLSAGPIHLESGVNLHLEEGADIRFGANPDDYLPPVLVRWEGTRCYNHSPFLYARGLENIALTGRGTIRAGGAPLWREWRSKQRPDRDRLRSLGGDGAPLERRRFGAGHYLRPDLFQAYDCRNVLVEDVTLGGSPFWTIHPVFCTNVTIRRVRVRAGATWNDDGIDPDSCRDVLIEKCAIETRDDAIAVKAGRERDGRDGAPCENVVVRDCTLAQSGLAVGSEMAGGVRNVFFEDVRIGRCEAALQVKADTDQGGFVEDVLVRRVAVGSCDACIAIRSDDRDVADHPHPPAIQRIDIEAVRCRAARRFGLYISGVEGHPIRDVTLRDVTIRRAAVPESVRFAERLVKRAVRLGGGPR